MGKLKSFAAFNFVKLVVLGALLVSPFVGCGGSNVDDENRVERYENNQRLKAAYESVRGTYIGTATSALDKSRTYRMELVLYITEVDAGKDSYGNPQSQPALKGRFRLLDYVGDFDNQVLDASYQEFNGSLTLRKPKSASGGAAAGIALSGNAAELASTDVPETDFVIHGAVGNEMVQATVTVDGGDWATFSAKLASRETPTSADTPSEDQRTRTERILLPYEGTYEGIVSGGRNSGPYPVRFTLRISSELGAPVLRALFVRLDMPRDGSTYPLAVSFSPLTTRVYLTMAGGAGTSTGRPPAQASNGIYADGTLVPGLLKVRIEHLKLGDQGTVEAKRVR